MFLKPHAREAPFEVQLFHFLKPKNQLSFEVVLKFIYKRIFRQFSASKDHLTFWRFVVTKVNFRVAFIGDGFQTDKFAVRVHPVRSKHIITQVLFRIMLVFNAAAKQTLLCFSRRIYHILI